MERHQVVCRLAGWGSAAGQQLLSRTPAITTERFGWAALTLPGNLFLIPSSDHSHRVSRVLGKVSAVQGNHICPLAQYRRLGCRSTFLLHFASSFFGKTEEPRMFFFRFFLFPLYSASLVFDRVFQIFRLSAPWVREPKGDFSGHLWPSCSHQICWSYDG